MTAEGARQPGAAPRLFWVHPVELVTEWLASAAPRDRLTYARGPYLVQGATSQFVRDKAIAGQIHVFQPKSEVGYDYIIEKRAGAPSKEARPEGHADEADAATDIILRELKRCANFGLRCPSDKALAEKAGLDTRAQVAWRMAELRKAKVIRSEVITTGEHAGWRIVTIVANGKKTAAPPGWQIGGGE